jgi:O-antigen/teichoic acid export membrane protein
MDRLARDGGLNLAGTVVSQIAGMATVLVLARSLGNTSVGVYSQAFALRALLMLICALGARVSMTHFVARYRADGDPGAVRGATRLGLGATAVVSTVAGLCLILAARPLAFDVFDDPSLVNPIRLAGVSLPFFVAMTVALAATQGFKTMRAFAGVGLIFEPTMRLLLTVVLVALGFGVGGAMMGLLVASMSAAYLAVRSLRHYINRMGPARPTYAVGEIARFSAYSWVASIATQGLLWSDIVILGTFVSSAEVGVYQVATRVVLLGTMVTPALTASLSPRVADAWRRNDRAALQEQYRALTGWTFRLSLPILVVILVFPQQILSVFGGGFDDGQVVIWWLMIGAVVETLSAPSAVTLNQANRNRVNMVINISALTLNLALNFMLIPMYGITGASIAWTVSLVVPGFARIVAVQMLVTGNNPWSRYQTRALVAAIVATATGLAFSQLFGGPWAFELIGGTLLVVAAYVGVIVLLGAADEDVAAVRAIMAVMRRMVFKLRRRFEKRRLRNHLGSLVRNDQPLRLDHLASPFRYDIEVRREFMALVAAHEAMWRSDPDSFMELARGSSYYRWYCSVAVHAIGVDADQPSALARGFERRVHKSLALFDEFRDAERFDRRFPVTVRPIQGGVGERKRLTQPRFVPVDGCHRIAMLMLNDRRDLHPDEYRIAPDSAPVLDNTERLVAELGLDDATYYRFISRGFVDEEYTNRDDLLAAIALSDPSLAAEVDEIMKIDEAALSAARSR